MALTPGSRLGVYEVTEQIGAGGMGEVYRARDPRLNRDVAIKVLLPAVANDPDRLARFSREAQVLASLNHPNIAHIYGLDRQDGRNGQDATSFLVMELVDGEEFSQRIARGPIPLDETLPIAKQIAEALEAAHEQGIIHRDLKPANIKVRPDGTVKVLDFGLAKAIEPAVAGAGASLPPTITTPAMTQAGIILGTAAYMSPEQARGKPLDKRTDIWAFGCVLYEMLTGCRAFAGEDVSDVLASVLAREPDMTALSAATAPPSIRRLLTRCLRKDRNDRLRDIGDARIEIADALARTDQDAPAVSPAETRGFARERLAWIAALAAVALAAAWIVRAPRPAAAAPEIRVDIATPHSTAPQALALSPDGGTLAFVASLGGQSRLWLRSLASGSSHALADTDGADAPFWSPDSRAIGFFADGKLRRVDVDGGSVQTITNAFGTGGGTWNRDNVILFASLGRPITRVGAIGGAPVELTGLTQLGSDFSPFFLPDGRHFLYYVRGNPEVRGVYVGDIDQQMETRRLLDADSSAVYASTGQLLFARHGTLSAQNFDAATLQLGGASFPVAGVRGAQYGPTQFGPSVSAAGSIAFRSSAAPGKRELVWFDRSGKQIGTVGDGAGDGSQPSLTRDGAHVAMYRSVNGNVDVWSLDTKRGAWSRLTSDPADDVFPVWSPDGSELVFSSNRTGIHNLYRRPLTAGGREERLFSSPQHKVATDWSADGRFIVFDSEDPKTGSDIWALPLDGKEKPFPVVNTKFDEHSAQFSPDGHWIAYQSNESGRTEIYIQPFPGPGNSSVISTAGGTQAHWGRDAKELFYVARNGWLTVVPIRLTAKGQAPDVGAGVPLFAPPLGRAVEQGDSRHHYMIASDSQRILVATDPEEGNEPITLILNWKPRP